MSAASVVLIVAEDEVQAVKSVPGLETDIRVFADTDAIQALQLITRDRPRLVVLGRAFTDSERGAALVNVIRTDETLADTQIRVLGEASDYAYLVSRQAEAGFAPGTALPGEPLPADYLGTRRARRFKMDAAVRARLAGTPTSLVDLCRTGAHVLGPLALHPAQRVDLSLVDSEQDLKIAASVAWVFFEPARGDSPPRYRAGVKFIDADPEIIEAFAVRHRQVGETLDDGPTKGRPVDELAALARDTRPLETRVDRAARTGGQGTILLVDDEQVVRRITKETLESDGYTVLEADSAEQAMQHSRMHEGPITLLITDLVMPRVDGFILSTRLKELRPEMRQLWISGYADRSPAVQQDLQASETPFLAKPYTPSELLRKVHDVLERPHFLGSSLS